MADSERKTQQIKIPNQSERDKATNVFMVIEYKHIEAKRLHRKTHYPHPHTPENGEVQLFNVTMS